jgi:hypothetical protein
VSSNKHTAKHPQEVGKESKLMKRVLRLCMRYGSVLQEANCRSSTRGGKACGKGKREKNEGR